MGAESAGVVVQHDAALVLVPSGGGAEAAGPLAVSAARSRPTGCLARPSAVDGRRSPGGRRRRGAGRAAKGRISAAWGLQSSTCLIEPFFHGAGRVCLYM